MNEHFSYYPGNIKSSRAIGSVSLSEFFERLREPSDRDSKILDEIAVAVLMGDLKEKARLKTKLLSYTPCVCVPTGYRRRHISIQNFTGLLVLDFDKVNGAKEAKRELFERFPWIMAAWLSPSGEGVKGLVRIPVAHSVNDFKGYFGAVEEKLGKYVGWDSTAKNPILPLFTGVDKELMVRENSVVWTRKKEIYVKEKFPFRVVYNSENRGRAIDIITRKIAHIDEIFDNGHGQLRAAAYMMGGFVGAGYLKEEEAMDAVDVAIDDSSYLSKGVSGYKRTAREMIIKGQKEPMKLWD